MMTLSMNDLIIQCLNERDYDLFLDILEEQYYAGFEAGYEDGYEDALSEKPRQFGLFEGEGNEL